MAAICPSVVVNDSQPSPDSIVRRCRNCVVSTMTSSLCVGILFTAYVMAGAFIFRELEQPHEIDTSSHLSADDVIGTTDELRRLIHKLSADDVGQARVNLTNCELTSVVRGIQERSAKRAINSWSPWSMANNQSVNVLTFRRWSLPGSLMYVVSLLTTVGCADVTPRTPAGLIITIPYATVGIPLCFYFLSRAGRDLAILLQWFYLYFFCDLLCCKLCQRRHRHQLYESMMTSHPLGTVNPAYVRNAIRAENGNSRHSSHVYESLEGHRSIAGQGSDSSAPISAHRRLAPMHSDSSVYKLSSTVRSVPHNSSPADVVATGSLPGVHRLHKMAAVRDKKLQTESLDRNRLKLSKNTNTKNNVRCSHQSHDRPTIGNPLHHDTSTRTSRRIDKDAMPALMSNFRRGATGRRSSIASMGPRRRATSQSSRKDKPGISRRTSSSEKAKKTKKSHVSRSSVNKANECPQSSRVGSSAATGCFADLVRLTSTGSHGSSDSFVTAYNGTPLLTRTTMNNQKKHDFNDDDDGVVDELIDVDDEVFRSCKAEHSTYKPFAGCNTPSKNGLNRPVSAIAVDRQIIPSPEIGGKSATANGANSIYRGFRRKSSGVPLPLGVVVVVGYVIGGAALFVQLRRRCSGSHDGSDDVSDWYIATFVSFAALTTVGGWYPMLMECAVDDMNFLWPPDIRYVYVVWLIGGLSLVAMLIRLLIEFVRTESAKICISCCQCDLSECCRVHDTV